MRDVCLMVTRMPDLAKQIADIVLLGVVLRQQFSLLDSVTSSWQHQLVLCHAA